MSKTEIPKIRRHEYKCSRLLYGMFLSDGKMHCRLSPKYIVHGKPYCAIHAKQAIKKSEGKQ